MKFNLTVDMGNAAFAEFPESELARILWNLGRTLEAFGFEEEFGETGGLVHDVNGNTVGRWAVAEDDA